MMLHKRQMRCAAPFASLILMALLMWSCGDPPASPPAELRGNLEVWGIMPNDSLADSVSITLDELPLGKFDNPHLCENLLAGIHLVEVTAEQIADSTLIEYSGAQQVEVLPDTTVQSNVALLGLAPNFELYDLDSNLVTMTDLRGKVILLYFFVST